MKRHLAAVAIAVLVLALCGAAALPRPAGAMSFVDKQVMAGALLVQSYINTYGLSHHFVYPGKTLVKKGGGLTKQTIWPSNPWTGKIMAPGTSRGTYTYKLRNNGTAYTLVVHLSTGNNPLRGGMPKWFKAERDQASLQNLLLLRWYIDAYAAGNGGVYPAATDVIPTVVGGPYTWPVNPWTGVAMTMGASQDATGIGDFWYTQASGGTSYSLKVRKSDGTWSDPLGPVPTSTILLQAM